MSQACDWDTETKQRFLDDWEAANEPTARKLQNKSYQVLRYDAYTQDMVIWEHMDTRVDAAEKGEALVRESRADMRKQIALLQAQLMTALERVDVLEERGEQRADEIRLKGEVIHMLENS